MCAGGLRTERLCTASSPCFLLCFHFLDFDCAPSLRSVTLLHPSLYTLLPKHVPLSHLERPGAETQSWICLHLLTSTLPNRRRTEGSGLFTHLSFSCLPSADGGRVGRWMQMQSPHSTLTRFDKINNDGGAGGE